MNTKLKVASIGFIGLALVLSIAQNIHYFLLYNTSLEALTACTIQPDKILNNYPIKEELLNAIGQNPNKSTIASKMLNDLIKQAKKMGITKTMLVEELNKKLD